MLTTFPIAVRLAVQNLWLNRVRSILTTMGVFIGVAAVVCIISLGEGVKSYFTRELAKYGSDTIYLVPFAPKVEGKIRSRRPVPFDNDTTAALQRYATTVYEIQPGLQKSGVAKRNENNYACSLYGGTQDLLRANNLTLRSGRNLTPLDINGRERVAILGHKVRKALFAEFEDPIGQTVRFNGLPFLVIGTLEEKGQLGQSEDVDGAIYAPYTTVQTYVNGDDKVLYYYMKMKPGVTREMVQLDLQPILRAQRKITDPTKDNYQFLVLDDFLEFSNNFLNVLVAVFGAVAAIALLVGGVGLMNIMLVAVAERTREIGLRKALGAPDQAILIQFLTEAVILTGSGGVGGLLAGYGLGAGLTPFLEQAFGKGVRPEVPWLYAIIIVLITCAIGIIFGVYPAAKASKMDPIRALRFD